MFLWWDSHDPDLPAGFQAAIESPNNDVFWEIAIKARFRQLVYSGSAAESITGEGFLPLPITVEHAEWAGSLPSLHRDPFDRLLVAQARLEGLTFVTVDKQILRYEITHL